MAGWGSALAIKLHGRLTQGWKETHRSVSGRVNMFSLHISPSLQLLSVAGVLYPGSGHYQQPPDVSGRREKLLSALCSQSRAGWSPQAPRMSPGPVSPLHDTDQLLTRGNFTTGHYKDCRACWHHRLEFEQNYKELIPSRPFSPPTPTVPGPGVHIMLTLSQGVPRTAVYRCGAHPSSLCSPDLKN